MSFFSRLESRVLAVDSLLCVGLDPHIEELESPNAGEAYNYCMRLVEATAEYTAAFKPNVAFFEVFGSEGYSVLKKVLANIPEEIPVVLDAKRGDIASTAQAYMRAVFHVFNADAVTINPYLGRDAVEPFLADPNRGVFLLCKTSNPGSADLQDLVITSSWEDRGTLPKRSVYEHIAELAIKWDRMGNLGLVVGSTHPESLKQVRAIAPKMWFLAPGVGAQGADIGAALRAGLRRDGLGMLIPVSRGISRHAYPGRAADDLRCMINEVRKMIDQAGSKSSVEQEEKHKLADMLLEKGCIRFAEQGESFTLKSGLNSPIYIDLRKLVTYPELLIMVASAYLPLLRSIEFERLAALPYAAIPITTAVCLAGGWSMIYPRKETKRYGTKADIEGEYIPGDRVVVVDDLATTGGSKFEIINKLTDAGLVVNDVVVLVDRQSGASEALAKAGYRMHAVLTLGEMLDHWERTGRLSSDQINSVRDFLREEAD